MSDKDTNGSEEMVRAEEFGTPDDMKELHGQLAREMRNQLMSGPTVLDKEGQPVRVSPTPALLNVVRQFLRDNHVSADGKNPNSEVADLVDELPFDED